MAESDGPSTAVLVNPVAGRRDDPGAVSRLVARLRKALPAADLRVSDRPGQERELLRDLIATPVERLIVAGGDGTLHQVVDAILDIFPDPSGRPNLAVLPLGSGNDFARGLGIALNPSVALEELPQYRPLAVDVGRLTFLAESPVRAVYWLNQSYLGFGASVVRRVARNARPADARAYSRAALREIGAARPQRFTLQADEGAPEESEAMNLLVTNGRFSGSGMLSSPRADPSDGLLDVVHVAALGRLRLLLGLRRFRDGTHLELPEVRSWRVRTLRVDSPGPVDWVEADGDIVGRLPVRYDVLPSALRFLAPIGQAANPKSPR